MTMQKRNSEYSFPQRVKLVSLKRLTNIHTVLAYFFAKPKSLITFTVDDLFMNH